MKIPDNVLFGRFITSEIRKLKVGQSLTFTFLANELNRKRAKSYISNKRKQYYSDRFGVYKFSLLIELIEGEITVERVLR